MWVHFDTKICWVQCLLLRLSRSGAAAWLELPYSQNVLGRIPSLGLFMQNLDALSKVSPDTPSFSRFRDTQVAKLQAIFRLCKQYPVMDCL